MKKYAYLFLLCALSFFSCQNDEDPMSLAGTEWCQQLSNESYVTLRFISRTESELVLTTGILHSIYRYTYDIRENITSLHPRNEDHSPLEGVINQGQINLVDILSGKTIGTLVRK